MFGDCTAAAGTATTARSTLAGSGRGLRRDLRRVGVGAADEVLQALDDRRRILGPARGHDRPLVGATAVAVDVLLDLREEQVLKVAVQLSWAFAVPEHEVLAEALQRARAVEDAEEVRDVAFHEVLVRDPEPELRLDEEQDLQQPHGVDTSGGEVVIGPDGLVANVLADPGKTVLDNTLLVMIAECLPVSHSSGSVPVMLLGKLGGRVRTGGVISGGGNIIPGTLRSERPNGSELVK